MTSQTPSGRARPLPPDERRAALIAATLSLISEHGVKVTTRQIAEAAGVAEGTIFRVFPHKDGLIRVAVETGLDPGPLLTELAEIDLSLPLPERLVTLVGILQRRLSKLFTLMHSIGMHGPSEGVRERIERRSACQGKPSMPNEEINRAIVRVLEPDRDQFRYSPYEVARLLRLLTFAGSHPRIAANELLSAEMIAAVVLDGVRHHPAPGADTDRPAAAEADTDRPTGAEPDTDRPGTEGTHADRPAAAEPQTVRPGAGEHRRQADNQPDRP